MPATDAGARHDHPSDLEDGKMNDDIGGSRGPRRPWQRRAGVLAVTAGVALLAACSSSSSSSNPGASASASTSSKYQTALAYSQCMRSHGVPDFPDPNSNGVIASGQGGRFNVSNTQLQAAESACRHLQTSGGQQSATQQQQALNQLVKYSQCMRAHGVPNFPDPTSGNGGMGFNLSGVNLHSPQYQSANQACQSLQRKGK
jgi:hypothetical protein